MKNPGKKYDYDIGIIGAGELGGNLYLELNKIKSYETSSRINLSLFGRTEEKPIIWQEMSGEQQSKTYGYKQLPDFLDRMDVLIFTASKGNKHDLEQNTRKNLGLIRNLARRLDDFHGLVVIASNQTDTLCYELAKRSKMNPLKIVGVNGLETERYRIALQKHFWYEKPRIQAYTAGFHHDSVMLTSKTLINDLPLQELISEEDIARINYMRKDMARNAVQQIGTTTPITVSTIKNLVLAIIDEEREETVSTIRSYKKMGIYMGLPVTFQDLQPIVNDYLIRKMSETEQEELEMACRRQIAFMHRQGAWENGAIDLDRIVFEEKKQMSLNEQSEWEMKRRVKELNRLMDNPIYNEEYLQTLKYIQTEGYKLLSAVKNDTTIII
ncbi:hypothetical protein H8D36_03885 [archaeon]|nr:hypothetical protein [archaeon]